MKKSATIVMALIAGIALSALSTPAVSNVWLLVTGRGFFIPAESSVFSFRATKMNDGSGEWWLYGEDRQHLFALHPTEPAYIFASKAVQSQCSRFDPLERKTWCSPVTRRLPQQ
jgi:hypothetical protein